MRLMESVGRWAARGAGLAAAAAVCVACSSSTSGSPNTGANTPEVTPPLLSVGGGTSVGALPSITVPSISGIPSLGSDLAGTPFCKDLTNFDPGSVTSDPASGLAKFDKLADEAPAEIKPDVEKIRDFLHGVINGSVNPSDVQDISQAAVRIGEFTAAHCAS